MSIEREVDRLVDERPGRVLLHPEYDEKAVRLHERVHRSAGMTSSYLVSAGRSRVIVNTGMGWETPHHRALFAEVAPEPTSYIFTTQGHVDHVGGVSQLRDPETRYVAQQNNARCQADDRRLTAFRGGTALTWFPDLPERVRNMRRRYPEATFEQDEPLPDITFDERLELVADDLEIELIHTPGGETIDSCVVWLPQYGIALVSNLFGPLFPHFPNFNTLRGDKYRFPVPYMENVDRVRALRPEMLITGRHLPIEGRELIDACLARMRGAVEYVHEKTLEGMNAGKDVYEIMRDVALPPELRVGQGYGKVEWGARTVWESYTGWFRRRSSAELYPSDPAEAAAELAGLVGATEVTALARRKLESGDAPNAIRLAEAVLASQDDRAAMQIMLDAHEVLLEGGDESFWESGWLRHQIERWKAALEG